MNLSYLTLQLSSILRLSLTSKTRNFGWLLKYSLNSVEDFEQPLFADPTYINYLKQMASKGCNSKSSVVY
jgi:hypothetical protein